MSRHRYADRTAAGEALAAGLVHWAGRPDVAVLALPRGGVPVAAPVARRLAAPLGLVMVAKLGVPGHSELAMGAVASLGGALQLVRNEPVLVRSGVSPATFQAAANRATAELELRAARYGYPPLALADQLVIVVDDGLATGSTMLAAVRAVRAQEPAGVVVAVPVAAAEAVTLLREVADDVVCPEIPTNFLAVGYAYADFSQVPDDAVSWPGTQKGPAAFATGPE